MIRSAALALTLGAVSGGLSPLAAQTVVAFSCFELRTVRDVPVELPDTLQVIVLDGREPPEAMQLPEHEGLVFGQFIFDLLSVAIVREDGEDRDYLWFRPEGDRMVGWWADDRSGPPNIDEPWQLEAHRFSCRRLSSG